MLSIIVPIYNVENVLSHCLNSLRFQSYRNIEIILINEGSSDTSGAICDRFARVDSRFKVLHRNVKNISEALNFGLEKAKGEFISFIDPVDRIDVLMFEKLILTIIKHKADMVIANHGEEQIINNKELIEYSETVIWTKKMALNKIIDQFQFKSFLCNKLYTSELFRSEPVNKFDVTIDIFGDLVMSVQCILKSKKIIYDPNLHYHYIAYRHVSFFNDLTKEKLSGPKGLLKVIDLAESLDGFDVCMIKEQYINYSILLLMNLLKEENKNRQLIKEAKKNLYHFPLSEVRNQRVKVSCVMARKMTYIYFNIWKKQSG